MASYTLDESEMYDVAYALRHNHDEYCMCSDHSDCSDVLLAEKIESELRI